MLNQRLLHISWDWQLQSTPEEFWPYISDTNRLFKDLHQPSIQQTPLAQTTIPDALQLSYNSINRYEVWEEEPYEWEYPYQYSVVRHYQSGTLKNLKIHMDLTPNKEGTKIECTLKAGFKPGVLSLFTIFKLKTFFKRRLKKTIGQYDAYALQNKKPYENESHKRLVRGGEKRLTQIIENLLDNDINNNILQKVIEYLRRADDLSLIRIQPFQLADYWEFPRKDVLEVFLQATNNGLLIMNWDLYCPDCRSIQETASSLNQVHEPVFCSQCDQEFNINFNRTIELSFRPSPLIRKIDKKDYCKQGPQTIPHVFIQRYMHPGENRFLKTELPQGTYTLRTNNSQGTATFEVSEDGQDTIHIALQSKGLNGEQADISTDPNLGLTNHSEEPQLVTLEKKSWSNTSVCAAEVTSLQLFRDLFPNETLRKGEKISVDNLTLMFTDLFDSTGMYKEKGDEQAVRKVIEHFEILQQAIAHHGGAIVKTIGDSVMAVFSNPGQALRAYLSANKMLCKDAALKNNCQLKAGIHHGSCMAVNMNNRIDYFGTTVNLASRFVDFASENEIIMSQDTLSDNEIKSILNEQQISSPIKKSGATLKGYNTQSFLINSITVSNSILRLAI